MDRRRALKILPLAILAPLVAFCLKILWDAGEFRSLTAVYPDCRLVAGVASSEDITIDRSKRTAFISAADRRSGGPGHIYAYDLSRVAASPRVLTGSLDFPFQPHGLSFVREEDGQGYLFAVNHRPQADTIERFRWDGWDLIHEATFQDPMLRAANDVAALSRDQFYVTVEGRGDTTYGRLLEGWFQLGRGYLIFRDGRTFNVAATGFSLANGVQLVPGQDRLLVASTLGRTISVFRRSPANLLTLEQVLDMGTAVDNLETDEIGRVWVAAHPRPLRFLWYMGAAGRKAPSEAFQIRIFEQTLYQKVPVFVDPGGSLLSASSVAAFDAGRLLIGSVADPRFLDCRLEE